MRFVFVHKYSDAKMTHINQKTSTKARIRALGVAFALIFASGNSLAATIGFSSPMLANVPVNDVAVNQNFTVDITGSGFAELAGGDHVNLGFDSSLLQITSVAINTSIFDFAPASGGPAVGNTWSGIAFDTFVNNPATGNFTIATISFKAVAAGSASLNILGGNFFSKSAALTPSFSSGTVNVTAVPVPAAAWLFGSGLIGLVGVARKRFA
jgi:hypothetical protein